MEMTAYDVDPKERGFDASGIACADWMPADELQYCQVASVSRDDHSFWALAGAYAQ